MNKFKNKRILEEIMAYSWDIELAGEMKERQNATMFHETDFLKTYVKTQASHTYLPAPKLEDYLTISLREGTNKKCSRCQEPSNKEVCNACVYKSASNVTYGKTETYDIASKLELYNPATSFTANYVPERKINLYNQDKEEYSI